MTVKTEGQHKGEFLVSEGPGAISREVGTLASGEVVTDGAVLYLDTGKLKASVGNASGEAQVGFAYGDYDATAGDLSGVVYITRLAEVKRALVHIDATDPAVDADTEAELLTRFLVLR